ncbi:MAG: hypothetical protein AB7P20_05070 [Rhizobiaceae bacterium]
MSDEGAKPGMIAVHATRRFGTEKYLMRKVPVAIGIMLVGAAILYLSDDDTEGKLLGFLAIGACLAFIVYAFHRRDMPAKPYMEFSRDGILQRLGNKTFRIPWHEIRDLTLVDIRRTKGRSLYNIAAVEVSRAFYEANMPVRALWGGGPVWGDFYVDKGDKVQIAFDHEVMSVPADELWNEIEGRWRAFSGNPDVPLLQVPHLPRARGWIGGWSPSARQKRVGLAVLCLLAIPAIYFWHWGVTALFAQRLTPGSASAYLDMMLDGTGLQARVQGGEVKILRRPDISGLGRARCETDVVRDTDRESFLPSYKTDIVCGADLVTTGGAPAYGVFKLVVETTQSPDWQGKMQEHRALVPARLGDDEVQAALCSFGSC